MAMTRRRASRYGRASYPRRFVRRVARNVERRDERKTLGRWHGVNVYQQFTTATASKVFSRQLLSTGNQKSVTIYGMDLLFSMQVQTTSPSTSAEPLRGYLMIGHMRAGQVVNDFVFSRDGQNAAPEGDEFNQVARSRAFVPFTLTQQLLPQRHVVIPYKFFRGHQIRILPNENLAFIWAFVRNTASGVPIGVGIHGRYRYIEKVA